MTRLALLGLVFLTAVLAGPSGGRGPKPPKGPKVQVPRKINATLGGEISFDFTVSGMEPLNISVIKVVKLVSRDSEPEEVRFDVELTELTEEEIAEVIAAEEAEHADRDQDDDREQRPHPTSIIVGTVTGADLTCDDHARYQVVYGKPQKKEDRREDLLKRRGGGDRDGGDREEGGRKPKPRGPPGAFTIDVESCEKPTRPQPEKRSRGDKKEGGRGPKPPKGPQVRVPRKINATLGGEISFDFSVNGMEPLNISVIKVVKLVSRDSEPEEVRFDVELTELTEEEIAEVIAAEEAEHADRDQDDDREQRPHPTSIIVGTVTGADLTCDDQARYQVVYGKPQKKEDRQREDMKRGKGGDRDGGDREEGGRKPKPRGPPGAFTIDVESCEKPTRPQPEN